MILLEFLNKILISLIGTGCNLRLSNLLYTEFNSCIQLIIVISTILSQINNVFLYL